MLSDLVAAVSRALRRVGLRCGLVGLQRMTENRRPERARPLLPKAPRPVKWAWAASVSGALAGELLLSCDGPWYPLTAQFLEAAGLVRICPRDCNDPAASAGAGGAAAADRDSGSQNPSTAAPKE
jgi:hypothetical protein